MAEQKIETVRIKDGYNGDTVEVYPDPTWTDGVTGKYQVVGMPWATKYALLSEVESARRVAQP